MPKFEAKEIKQLVEELEGERSHWRRATTEWQQMWELYRYDLDRKDAKDLHGMEQVITSDPFNIVQLVSRFVASEVRIEVPYASATEKNDNRSMKMEEWLTSFWTRSGRQQRRNIPEDMTWWSAVRGRGAMQVAWISKALKDFGLEKRRLPILPRTLDPLNVGVCRGPYWTEYAYHRYTEKAAYVRQMYPNYKFPEVKYTWQHHAKEYEVIDFYYMDKGSVWNCVVIEGQFAKKPVKTDYIEIPLFEWYADGAPLDDELAKSLSILHPVRDLWKYKCDLATAIGTGLLYYFDPIVKAIGFQHEVTIGPGEVINLPAPGMDLEFVRGEPNVPMAEKMLQLVQTSIDQSTFPAVLYGEQPGGVQAGFAINSLAQQARNRVKTIRSNLEAAFEYANELILSQVEHMAGEDGIEVWGSSEMSDRSRPHILTKRDIKGVYNTEVSLIPEIPTDETGRINIWLQMVRDGIVSKQTMRDRALNVPLPRDEENRIAVEQAMMSQDLQPKTHIRALQSYLDKTTFEKFIAVTNLQGIYDQEQQWEEQKRQEEEQEKAAKEEAKRQAEMQAMMQQMGPSPLPGGMGGPMTPGLGDPSMGQPPMDPMMMPPGMPPGGMPLGPESAPPMPISMGDPSMQLPGAPGMSPESMGQLTPEMLGIPPSAPPGTFNEMTGQPLSEQELLDAIARQSGGAGPLPL